MLNLGDGIFDQLSNEDVSDCVWMTMKNEIRARNIHNHSALIVDMIIKSCMMRNGLDNLTCSIITFSNFEKSFNKLEFGREEGIGKSDIEKIKSNSLSKEIYIKTASDNNLAKYIKLKQSTYRQETG